MTATVTWGQPKKTAPSGAASSAASKICSDPYQVREPAEGWPEAPVVILFHHEKSKAPWATNPAIRVAGLEARTPASARTLVCVEESKLEMGHYTSGEPGYAPAWEIIVIRLADRKVYFMRTGMYGEMPPEIKWKHGAGVGKAPTETFVKWMRLVVGQDVARLKMRLKSREYHDASALAFSADNSKLVLAQEPRSSGSGTPPSPITVFDLTTGQVVVTMHASYSTRAVAISRSGSMVATERYGHVELWDVASGLMTRKLETSGVKSLRFGPDDTLGVAGNGKSAVWDIAGNRVLRSGTGSQVQLSPEGAWLVADNGPRGVNLQALESGRELAKFPRVGDTDQYEVSGDGKLMVRASVLGGTIYTSGNPQGAALDLPHFDVNSVTAVASTRDGFVAANGDGIAGIVSSTTSAVRAFATDLTAIRAIAVSSDGKLIALGDSSGSVQVWELK